MSHNYLKASTVIPQSEPLPGQVQNSAGGYSYAVDEWSRLERFLILGSEGGSYYATERELTKGNTTNLEAALRADAARYIKTIVDISEARRAPKNDPALFALALAFAKGDSHAKSLAAENLHKVARTGTHLFHFIEYAEALGRGWGRGFKNAVASWYLNKPTDKLAYQMLKYQSRDGWSHKDLLRLSHPKNKFANKGDLFAYVVEKPHSLEHDALKIVRIFEELKKSPKPANASSADKKRILHLITDNRVPRELVPTEWLNDVEVWDALLVDMPMMATVRNLGKMTSIGLIKPLSDAAKLVSKRLKDEEVVRKSRVHPLNLLTAQRTYASNHGMRGSLSWQSVPQVLDALEEAFYLSFGNVQKTGLNHYLALDVSGSMSGGNVAGSPMTPAEASAALSMVAARTEENYIIKGFNTGVTPLKVTAKSTLDQAIRAVSNINFGGTDCSLPMIDAERNKLDVDIFHVYTDNETWAGVVHPSVALKNYRKSSGRNAKLAVVGMVSNGFSIADPNDAGMLDVVGFDSATPAILADFATGGKSSFQEDSE